MSHPFVVVFRFLPESPLTSADIEDDIAEALGNPRDNPNADHVVDGNEIGECLDIFVFSRDPETAFTLCRPMLEAEGLLDELIVASRPVENGDFNVIYPDNFAEPFRL